MTHKPNDNENTHINKDKAGTHYTCASACYNNKNNFENKSTYNADKDIMIL